MSIAVQLAPLYGRTVALCAVLDVVADATVESANAAGANARPPQVAAAANAAAARMRRPVNLWFCSMFTPPSAVYRFFVIAWTGRRFRTRAARVVLLRCRVGFGVPSMSISLRHRPARDHVV